MTDQVQNKSEDVEDPVQHFREMLLNGSITEAKSYMIERQLPEETVKQHIDDAFHSHKDMHQIRVAIHIAKEFDFDNELLLPLLSMEWKRLFEAHEYEEAALWAQDQGLPEVEIHRAAMFAYEDYVSRGETDSALNVLSTYGLKKEELLAVTITEFNRLYQKENFYNAALLGREFSFSGKRTYGAAMEAVKKEITAGNFERAVELISQFDIFTSEVMAAVGEDETIGFLEFLAHDFVESAFSDNKLSLLKRFTDTTGLLTKPFEDEASQNFVQKFYSIAVMAHSKILKADDAKSALFIRNNFNLYTKAIPQDQFITVIDAALKYHLELLKAGDLKNAVNFKEEYLLFSKYALEGSHEEVEREVALYVVKMLEKGDLSSAKKAIQVYEIDPELIENALFKAMSDIVDKGRFGEVIRIVEDFKLKASENENRQQVQRMFTKMIGAHEYMTAADFAKKLKMGKKFIEDAAFRAWQVDFIAGKYDTAFELKDKFDLPKRMTLELAGQAYWMYMEKKNYEVAVSIRQTYHVPITFMQWIIEFFKVIFKQ
ncbi:hypothetical protein ACFL6I_02910 [candidate division KSB1 bacterium]